MLMVSDSSIASQGLGVARPREGVQRIRETAVGGRILALAPMQDITDLPFWRLLAKYGAPDVYFTEYFRVHVTSTLDRDILASITENTTGRPVVAQLVGEDVEALVRTAIELQKYPVVGIDLNLGCPAPLVCRKGVAGALLREPDRIDFLLGALREVVHVSFSVKTRLGYESVDEFGRLLDVYARHPLDLLSIHGRTVKQLYRPGVDYRWIERAVRRLPYPVLANGDINSASQAQQVLAQTGAAGVMIGRAAVRNPWLFTQIRQSLSEQPVQQPTGRDFWNYLRELLVVIGAPITKPRAQIEKLKKYLNFIGPAMEAPEPFLYTGRRLTSEADFDQFCRDYFDHDRPLRLELPV